ncbi:MAG: cupredoxin domain-containing protein [Chloroflexi bacterium]|nr:cupredoxin domain-containing protein [Chloroflexota bacterium]
MNRAVPILAIALIAIGVVGLVAVGWLTQTPFGYFQGYGSPGRGMMGGMMGGYGFAPNVNATPVPSDKPIDREIKITARNWQFDPPRMVVKKGETVRFTITNQDAVAHNFVSQDGDITYTFLPPNATVSVVWVAPEKGTYLALCTFHAGMQMQVIVE